MNNIITENELYVLRRPKNSWDTNYHLYEKTTSKEYLIDIHDIVETIEELNEYGGILFSDLCSLNMDYIECAIWKTI